jgi:acyl transferase domain-containing protein/predicted O-methyltransferase YrrM
MLANSAYQRGLCSAKAKKVNPVIGSMLAVGIGENEVLPFIKQVAKGLVTIACVNSPKSTTISGDEIAIDELKEILDENSIFNRKLKVDIAYHSHHMMKVAPSYLASCEHIRVGLPDDGVSFFSSAIGGRKTADFGPEYWAKNLTSRVRFSEALLRLTADVTATKSSSDSVVFIEIGPHSTLAGPLRQTLDHGASQLPKYTYLSALIRDKSASHTALSVVAKLFEFGATLNLKAVSACYDSGQNMALLPNLPSYSWDHGSFWLESRLSRDHRFREFPYHDLCGVKDVMSNLDEPRWRYHVNIDALPWIKDHVVDRFILFPGSGYVCMVIEAMKQLIQMRKIPGTVSKFIFRNILFSKSLIVPEHAEEGGTPEVELQLTLSPARNYDGSRWECFRIFSYGNGSTWNEHCSGLCAVDMVSKANEVEGTREADLEEAANLAFLQKIKTSCTKEYDPENFYEDMKNSGNSYGPNFAILHKVFYGDFVGFTKMKLPDIRDSMPYGSMQQHTMHPTTLDAITHFGGVLFKMFVTNSPAVPVKIGEISISADITSKPGDELFMAIEQEMESDRSALSNMRVYQKDANGKLKTVVTISESQLRAIGESHTNHKDVPFNEQVAFQMAWDTDAQFLTEEMFLRRISNIDMRSFLYANGAKPVGTASMSFDDMAAATLIRAEKLACILLRNALRRIDVEKIEVTIPHMVKQLTWIRKWCSSPEFHRFIAQVGDTEQETALLSTAHDRGLEWEIGIHVGNTLPEILSGRQDPLALFVEDDWSAFYKSGAFQVNYTQMAEYIRLLAFKKPHMRILEIGAGSGASTVHLLRALTRDDGVQFDRYSYTDISPRFFEQARSDFAEWDEYIDYKVLDIDRDPLEQGFTAGDYDVVLCTSVLHATKVMDTTMKNIRKLIKPGGKLVFIEITRFTAALQLIFGCLSG